MLTFIKLLYCTLQYCTVYELSGVDDGGRKVPQHFPFRSTLAVGGPVLSKFKLSAKDGAISCFPGVEISLRERWGTFTMLYFDEGSYFESQWPAVKNLCTF